MLCKFSLLTVVAPLVSGLVLQTPENPTSGGTVTIKWTNQQGDPDTWSFELVNPSFNNAFAIANNVDPASNSITLTLPIIPVGDGYTLEAVNIGNITDVFASTGDFAVGATTTSSTSAASSSTDTATGTKTATSVTTTPATLTPGFSSVISPANPTTLASSITSPASVTTANGAANTTTTTAPTSAALSSRVGLTGSIGGFAAVVFSAVAGAAMLAL